MKANEAPEKIYINSNIENRTWLIGKGDISFIEYVRTDAFIEKVCKFFGEHLWEYINVKNANCDTFINIDGDKLIEDFRKYMKGE